MVDTGLKWLFLAVALLACASAAHAQAQQVSPARRAYIADAHAVKAFCASPEFKSLQCGWASEKELKLTAKNQCAGRPAVGMWDIKCDAGGKLVPDKLPAVLTGPSDYVRALSLACKGRIVVRAVYKLLSAPERYNPYLSNRPAGALYAPPGYGSVRDSASRLVRCKLQMPAGPEPEEARALKAKEVDCVECSSVIYCPQEVGTWYRWACLLGAWAAAPQARGPGRGGRES
jgi:hypothetical protein